MIDNFINEFNVITNYNSINILDNDRIKIIVKFGKYNSGYYSGYCVHVYGNDFHSVSSPVLVNDNFKFMSEEAAINDAVNSILLYLDAHNDKKYINIVNEYLNKKRQLTLNFEL